MSRLKANISILRELERMFHKYPDMRFHQGLITAGVTHFAQDGRPKDQFYEESAQTLVCVRAELKKLGADS